MSAAPNLVGGHLTGRFLGIDEGGEPDCEPVRTGPWGDAGQPAGHLTARTRQLTSQARVRRGILLFYTPKHSAARKRPQQRRRIAGIAVAASATVVTGISLSPPAQADGSVWDAVAACESTGNWAANTGNSYHGGLQISNSTWQAYGGGRHASSADRASRSAQIRVARRVLAAQGPDAWPVCGRRAGLSQSSGGTDTAPVSQSRAAAPVSRSMARTDMTYQTSSYEYQTSPEESQAAPNVDGDLGPVTVRAIQRWVDAPRDGYLGLTTTRALQREVGSEADGIIGPLTMRALQVKVGAPCDGSSDLEGSTVSAVQRYLALH